MRLEVRPIFVLMREIAAKLILMDSAIHLQNNSKKQMLIVIHLRRHRHKEVRYRVVLLQ